MRNTFPFTSSGLQGSFLIQISPFLPLPTFLSTSFSTNPQNSSAQFCLPTIYYLIRAASNRPRPDHQYIYSSTTPHSLTGINPTCPHLQTASASTTSSPTSTSPMKRQIQHPSQQTPQAAPRTPAWTSRRIADAVRARRPRRSTTCGSSCTAASRSHLSPAALYQCISLSPTAAVQLVLPA